MKITKEEMMHVANLARLDIDEAIVEIAEVTFDGNPTRTIAVEHADPELVLATVKKLKLNNFENINYIKAMKNQFGLEY